MKVAIGCDHLAFKFKEIIVDHLKNQENSVVEISDFGVYDENPVDYPDIAFKVAESVVTGDNQRGILICGTGIGMAIAANKVPGIFATVVCDPYMAERARKSNNAHIITLGALTTGIEVAKMYIDIWLDADFQGGRSERKVSKISAYEKEHTRG